MEGSIPSRSRSSSGSSSTSSSPPVPTPSPPRTFDFQQEDEGPSSSIWTRPRNRPRGLSLPASQHTASGVSRFSLSFEREGRRRRRRARADVLRSFVPFSSLFSTSAPSAWTSLVSPYRLRPSIPPSSRSGPPRSPFASHLHLSPIQSPQPHHRARTESAQVLQQRKRMGGRRRG